MVHIIQIGDTSSSLDHDKVDNPVGDFGCTDIVVVCDQGEGQVESLLEVFITQDVEVLVSDLVGF